MKSSIFISILIFVFSLNDSLAQDFEVAPVKMYFNVDPGSKQMKVISIKNHSNKKQGFNITTEDFIIDKYGQKQSLPKNSTKSSCADWITFSSTFFDVNPNESVDIEVTMTPPSGNWATRWANVYIQTSKERTAYNADKNSRQASINLSGRIAVQIIRNAQVKLEPKGAIEDLKEIAENSAGRRVFTALVKNQGATIYTAKVFFLAANLQTAEEVEFDPISVEIFPGFSREIEFTLPNSLPAGEYSLSAILDYGSRNSLEGTRLNKKLIIIR